MEEEFPGVVDLNVSGTHYRTLLSTLTRDEDSKLAAMFTGQIPVFKDKDDRYFIEADGFTFNAILHYLRYDELPFQEASSYAQTGTGTLFGGFGFGGGGARTGVFGDRQYAYSARNIEMLYKDALNLGLTKLVRHLEQFQPNFVNIKMVEYRKSIRGYDSCLAEILNIIPAESLFHKIEFTLRIKQDLQTIQEEKCCEHECKMMPWNSFGQPYYTSIDAVVKVPFEINPTVLSALAIDLQKRGYIVQGRMTVCDFDCKKEVKQSKYIVFAGQAKKCCAEELFLLSFKWDTEADLVTHPGVFGSKQFGQKQTTGGLFGARPNTGFSFGSTPQTQTGSGLFGGAQQGSVGQAQTSGFGFGGGQQGNFGQAQTFGGGQQGNFGQAQTSVFGSTQQQATFGQGGGQQGSFGQHQTSGFGAASTKGSGFSFSGGQQQQSVFSKQPQQKAFSFAQPDTQQQGSSQFGSTTVGFGQQQGSGLFGSSSFSQQQTTSGTSANKSLFGSSSSTFAGNQNLSFGSAQTENQKTNVSGLGGFSFQSPQKQQTAFAGKGASFGSQQSGQSVFGGSPNKSQHVFGGTPSFENKFGGLSLQQTAEKPDQSSSSVTTSADDKSKMLFGKPATTGDSGTQQLELDSEQLEKVQ